MFEFNVFNDYRNMYSVAEECDWERYLTENFSCKLSQLSAKSFASKIETMAKEFVGVTLPKEEGTKLVEVLTLFGNVCILKFIEEISNFENLVRGETVDED